MRRNLFTSEHEDFRGVVREFVSREVTPHMERWDEQRIIDRQTWIAAGKQGIIGLTVPEELGGAGLSDYRFRCIVAEELGRVGAASLVSSFGLHDDVIMPYFTDLANADQQARWLPRLASGELISAIAMTEPGAGSDLQGIRATAVRDGEHFVLNGTKTFITSGIHAGVVIVVARTDPDAGSRGFSLLVVEEGMAGFTRGAKLAKVGMHAQDTAELFFADVRVPMANLLGTENGGFGHLMENLPMERLSIAYQANVSSRACLSSAVEHTTGRHAFGQPLAAFQNTQFELADMVAQIDVVQAYLDACVVALNAGELTPVDAAKAKLVSTELQHRVVDRCLQLFGGWGYMMEYPIARAYVDHRVQTIFGGSTEIMKVIIGRDLTGLR
jgi:alkylation response protein AidB-like acyl-CoA dehydrogenase